MILTRDTIEIEIVLQEYTYKGIKRLVLHLDSKKSIPMHPSSYDGITLIKLAPNHFSNYLRWPQDRFPFILFWGAGHSSPCRTWKSGLKMFENIKTRMLAKITKEVES